MRSATFTIHTIVTATSQLTVLDLLDNSLQLLQGNLRISHILLSHHHHNEPTTIASHSLPSSNCKVIYARHTELAAFIVSTNLPQMCGGSHRHSQSNWVAFFTLLESLKAQCLAAGRRLVSVMGEIRASDNQGIPSRRQLYAQHRALSRALMDPDLQNLRRKGTANMQRLKTIATSIGDEADVEDRPIGGGGDDPVSVRMCEVLTIFDEVDRAARRLEQLTEQRRERLRELTRQRAVEDEINEVS